MIKTVDLNNEIINLNKELILIDNVNTPFASLALKNTQKVGSTIVDWKYETIGDVKNPAYEGADVTEFQASDRTTGDKNVCQILERSVAVSNTAQAVQLEGIRDLFIHEVNNQMLAIKKDLEYYLINGVYQEQETTSKPRQMKGLVNFLTKSNNSISDTELTLPILQEMAKMMRKAGTASQNLALLCDYNTTDAINTLFSDQQRYVNVTNEFGNPVQKINLTYGSAYIYTIDAMPVDTCILANMDYIGIGELRPLEYRDLAVTGDSRKGMLTMENTLMVKHPVAAVKFTKNAE